MSNLNTHRREYAKSALTEKDVSSTPLEQLDAWMVESKAAELPDYNAFALNTVDTRGFPQARIVLLREISDGLVFYTNYSSAKGLELGAHAKCGAHFFWPTLERQVRLTGVVTALDAAKSDTYFASRPRKSQLSAWASKQSQTINSRSELEAQLQEVSERFKGKDIQRPPHWGGYSIEVRSAEFWQGRPGRLHDRLKYTKAQDAWTLQRLQP